MYSLTFHIRVMLS